MGIVHRPDPGWASHMPMLIKALELTDGPVLELGLGYFSTPLLHTLCAAQNRHLTSFESDEQFIKMFRRFETDGHAILWTDWDDWAKTQLFWDWSVVLVDQKPAEARAPAIKHLVEAEYVIIHDSNDPVYGYEEIYPLFKYKFTHEYLQHTTVLSNKHNVNKLYNTFN